jgi:hypothetical protein
MDIKNLLIGMVASFVTRQVQKFADDLDISKVKADLDVRVRALVPGDFLDEEACNLTNQATDIVYGFIKGDTDDRCVKLMVEGKYAEAMALALAYAKAQLGV